MTERRPSGYIFGVSIAWIAVFGAIVGFTNLIPAFPYFGGGGYFPFAVVLAALSGFILGPWAGFVAAFIGGMIGVFITPAAYPMYILDAFQVAGILGLYTGLVANGNKHWKEFTVLYIVWWACMNAIPYYFPGAAMKFEAPPQPLYFLMTCYYVIPWLAITVSPIGRKKLPEWIRSDEIKERAAGVFLASLISFMCYYTSITFWIYWYWLHYPADLVIAQSLYYYSWVMWVFAIMTTIVTMAVVPALKKSGFPPIPEAIW